MLDAQKLLETFTNAKCVYHTAAVLEFNNYNRLVSCLSLLYRTTKIYSFRAYAVNVVGTQNVINACIRAGVTKLVFTSSVLPTHFIMIACIVNVFRSLECALMGRTS